MENYIYELHQAPVPADEWTVAWEYHEHPDAFPIADIVEDAEDRSNVIARFGAWLKENRLGELSGETFTVDAQAADRCFERRFAAFQQAIAALQQLNEAQFIHEHNRVQGLIDGLTEIFTQKYGDYLLSLRTTDSYLINHCGFAPAAEKLYSGKENRGKRFDALRESGGDDAVNAALAEEREEIERFGSDPVRQTRYIHSLLTEHVDTYREAKENGGQTFPDFAGALILDDLARCQELSAVHKAKRQEERDARRARAEAEEKAYCEEQNRAAEQAVSAAIQVIRNGGILENKTVTFYQSRYSASSYSIVNYLMRLYHVDVPLRTQGWINSKLFSATIQDGKCEHLQYYPCKNCRCSQKFFDCMNALVRAVAAQAPNGKDAA